MDTAWKDTHMDTPIKLKQELNYAWQASILPYYNYNRRHNPNFNYNPNYEHNYIY
jgi:hypothetical protein